MLNFRPSEADSRTFSITGFNHPSVAVYAPDDGLVLQGIEVASAGEGYQARFEADAGGIRYVAVDSGALRRPDSASRDVPTRWRGEQEGAEYVVLTHSQFRAAADQLAEHRRASGLSAAVVDVHDIYDEFAFGQVDPWAIRTFVENAFSTWMRRPVYLVLFGAASFDYNDVFGRARAGRPNFVPALPFQRSRRGLAFTDHLYGSIGDDGFPDVFVGRFSVTRAQEAETVLRKVVGYDQAADARWRDRMLYMANYEALPIYSGPNDSLAVQFTEPLGLETFRVYNKEGTPPEPNQDTGEVIRQINEGRLWVNYAGHGSVSIMAYFLRGSYQQGHYSYMTQIANEERLPVVIAMSCLNGLYADPRFSCLAEEMTNKANGGAIAHVSASSLAFVLTNEFINREMFRHTFRDSVLQFGQSLGLAKIDWLSAFPQSLVLAYGMNLVGDPAQSLALPSGPDYAVLEDGIRVEVADTPTEGDSIGVVVAIENWGIRSGPGLDVLLLDRNMALMSVDTLFAGTLPPFGQQDSVAGVWTPSAGDHVLEVVLDPSSRIEEADESNNRTEYSVEVVGALRGTPTTPRPNQVVTAAEAQLGVLSEDGGRPDIVGEFQLSTTPSFDGAELRRSGDVGGEDGFVRWRPDGLVPDTYYWRARLSDGSVAGPWTTPRGFIVASSAPERDVLWKQDGALAFTQGTTADVALVEDGSVARVRAAPPIRFETERQEAAFIAQGLSGTAVLCTDGRYLYAKRKPFVVTKQAYPGSDVFMRIGTGLGGTVAGQNYGELTTAEVRGISATYHGDGYIYADDGARTELVRISPQTGTIDRAHIPSGLLEVRSGLSMNGYSLITSDGSHIYNVSYGVNGIPRAGWTVRVFDPENDWQVVREFLVEPTGTGFAYLNTDGVIADGRYLYLVEYGTGMTHRVRVVDAFDGSFVDEYESDQAETDILSGQYDWLNNQVWFGQLNGPGIYRYSGRRLPAFGSVTSEPIGPAGSWNRVDLSIRPGAMASARWELDVLGVDPTGTSSPLPGWTGLNFEGTGDLAGLEARLIRLRLRLHGDSLGASPGLAAWAVHYGPEPVLALSGLRAEPAVVAEAKLVQLTVDVVNRGPLDLVLGTAVGFYSGSPEGGRLIGRTAVPEDVPIGVKRSVPFVWNTARFGGRHFLTARVEDLQGRPGSRDVRITAVDPVEVSPSGDGDAPEVELTALDAAGEVRPGDFLPSVPSFQVVFRDSSGIDPASVRLVMTGPAGEAQDDIASQAVRDRTEERTSLSFIYAPELEDGEHALEVSASDRIGNGPARKTVAFRVSSDLQIERVLNVPNPVSDGTTFTYILSRPADVTVRIHTLYGRLVRRLDNLAGRAGYNQVFWDGRDAGGHPLANGVYLYTVTAEDGSGKARVKERLVVYR